MPNWAAPLNISKASSSNPPPGIKARTAKLGMAQRAAVHAGSKTDSDEAFLAGRAAVEAAIRGRDR